MSFFKHLRSSVTRKHNTSDETSHHLRNGELSDSSHSSRRRKTRSLFISREDFENEREAESTGVVRSETFTINEHESIFVRNQEATRASMFGRFGTFTKKKRSNSSGRDDNSGSGGSRKQKNEERKITPKTNENLSSSSYKRYPTPSDIVSNKSDQFHNLYERGNQQSGVKKSDRDRKDLFEKIDYGTYRKNKLSSHIREQLEEERSPSTDPSKSRRSESHQKEKSQQKEKSPEEGADKFKTVTINSFRKSFRDRFLKQQKEVPYNPSWFIEVDVPKLKADEEEESRHQNVLVFENEQYRPTARSPIRREYQSPTRSPTKKESSRTPGSDLEDERHIHRSQSPGRRYDQSTGRSTGQSRGRSPTARSSRPLDQYSTRSPERSSTAAYLSETYRRRSSEQSQGRTSGARSPSKQTDQSSTPRSRSPGVHHHPRSSERAIKQSFERSPNRSPSRDLYYIQSSEEGSQPRSKVTVKRNDTFKVDRESNGPSIRIEIKNSITPNEPGRIVPVGVAKPIQSPVHPDIIEPSGKPTSGQHKLYQTCIQISSNPRDAPQNRSLRERNSNQIISNSKLSKKFDPSSNSYISNYSPLKSYELLSNMKPRNDVISSYSASADGGYYPRGETVRGGVHQQHYAQQTTKTTVIPSQTYDSINKRWISAPTIASQQRISTYATDKLGVVIREVEDGVRCEECNNICAGYSPHEWRKTCQSCKCPREAHAIYQEQVTSVRERLGFKPENQTSRIDPRQLGYTWVPPGIMTSAKVQRYFDKIPQEKVPKVGTTGERYRERQITLQLPKQDLALDHCKHIESQHRASYEDFVSARNEIALDIGYIKDAPQSTKCVNCDDRIAKGDLAVIAPKFRDQMMWHPKCFACTTCDELLVDLTYCVHEEKIYCERHYAELLKPRCNACDEAKKSGDNEDVENVSNDTNTIVLQTEKLITSYDPKTSNETEGDMVACEKSEDKILTLRRSPRQEDLDLYEARSLEQEHQDQLLTYDNMKLGSLSPPSGKISPAKNNNDSSISPELTNIEFDITQDTNSSASIDTSEQKFLNPAKSTNNIIDNISPSLGIEQSLRGTSPSYNRSKTPVVEIVPPPSPTPTDSEESNNNIVSIKSNVDDQEIVAESTIPEGISDFYDFNASINPSRSPSVDKITAQMRQSRSPSRQSQSPMRPSRSPSKPPISSLRLSSSPRLQTSSHDRFSTDRQMLGESNVAYKKIDVDISDFYDFCIMMNQLAYGIKKNFDRPSTPRSATEYLSRKLQITKSKSKSPSPLSEHSKNVAVRKLPSPSIESTETDPTNKSIKHEKTTLSSPLVNLPKNETFSIQQESGGTKSNNFKAVDIGYSPIDTPETPDFQRTLSANMRYVETMREEYRQNMFKRSQYVGESMDFENDFEELRERTRHFRRSQSKSRSPPLPQDEGDPCTSKQADAIAARHELQDRILAEITKTTINYQDFSRDQNQKFIDYERRGSDSALLQKSQIMIQIDDERSPEERRVEGYFYKDYDYDDELNDMEGEEYHHFRRFSLNQEQQVDNEYLYLQNYEIHQTKSDTVANWAEQDQIGLGVSEGLKSFETVDVNEDESDHAETEDCDSESEDDRQTVVEVDDEIDEDVFDYERPDEYTTNEQSECEEAEREMDRYANKNADDWNTLEEGAVGGIEEVATENIENLMDPENVDNLDSIRTFEGAVGGIEEAAAENIENLIDSENVDNLDAIRTFDIVYRNALANAEESGIQKDYETIVNSINESNENEEFRSSIALSDAASIKTDELLDEILREDAEKYKHYYPKMDYQVEEIEDILDEEIEWSTTAPISRQAKKVSIKSTRLRSRYGLPPPPIHRNFDDIVDDVDLNYKPKREYQWRKNFKLDDNDDDETVENRLPSQEDNVENGYNDETLFTNDSVEAVENFENSQIRKNFNSVTENLELKDELLSSAEKIENICNIEEEIKKISKNHETNGISEANEESQPIIKKKKIKRKSRKASKGSIGEEVEILQSWTQNENVQQQNESGIKKRLKKKKKIHEITSPNGRMKSPTPPDNLDKITLTTAKYSENTKWKSPSPIVIESQIPTNLNTSNNPLLVDTSIEKDSKSSSPYLTPTPTPTTSNSTKQQSPSKSPEPTSSSSLKSIGLKHEPSVTPAVNSPKPKLERADSTGVYELIKDGSMYPWF